MAELADEVSDPGPVFAELRDRVDDARPLLPPDAGEPEFTENKIEAFTVIAALRWLGPPRATPRGSLRRLAENLQDRMRQLHGTEDVELFGAVEEEVEVTVSPETLVALGRSASDLARATRGADPKVAAGQRFGARNDLGVEVAGELRSLERIRAVPIRQGADGRVVRLGDVARVQKVVRDPPDELAVIDGAPAVVVAARMQPGRRVDRWSDGARAALAEFARGLPADVALELIFDQSRYTAARMNGLRDNLLLGVALVALVMLFMMGWRSSLLVGISLPTTMLMALTGLWFMRVPSTRCRSPG